MEKSHTIIYGRSIEWRLTENSSKFIKIKSFGDLTLINPLYYNSNKSPEINSLSNKRIKINEEILISTNGLIFKKNVDKIDYDSDNFNNFIRVLISKIKSVSKQYGLMPNMYAAVIKEHNLAGLKKIDNFIDGNKMMVRYDLYYTALTWNGIKKVVKQINTGTKSPIYNEILTDAFEGLISHDYRKVILYSCIAIESIIAILIDEEYQRLLNKRSKKIRIDEIQTSNGIQLKDSVYSKLKKLNNFDSLINERLAYIFNRSMKIEAPNLYKDLRKLYSTRNKLVHTGEYGDDSDKLIPANREGALFAFELAKKTFKWMGNFEFEMIHVNKFLEIKTNA